MEQGPACAFLRYQVHLATEDVSHADPTDLDEYLRHDGFKALEKGLHNLTPEQLIEEIRKSGLRGRGGAGFPTHLKLANRAEVVIANGAECEPLVHVDQELMIEQAISREALRSR